MAYVANGLKAVQATPSAASDRLTRVGPSLKLSPTGKKFVDTAVSPNSTWIEIFLPDDKTAGWILQSEFREVADEQLPPLDEESFVRGCLTVERELNADSTISPWYVAADFLIVRALLETGMSNGPTDAGKHIGPMAVTSIEWDSFLASNFEAAKQFAVSDRQLLLAQIFAAGCAMNATAKAFSLRSSPAAGSVDGPNVPSYLDLFLAYLTDPETAARLADPALVQTDTLATFGLSPETISAIAQRQGLSSTKASTTVSALISNSEVLLARLLDAAFDKMKTLAGDELPKATSSEPTWLPIARAEMSRPVSETVNADRIVTYFKTIDFPEVGSPPPHWCGAFVGFCMKTAGFETPAGPARAANWKTWGRRSFPLGASEIPRGAVVVLKPQDARTSGHVGFFIRFSEGRKVELLGGNQDDQVNLKSFPISQISAIRMLGDDMPVGAGDEFDMTKAGVAAQFQRYGDLIVDRFRRAGFDTRHQLAAVLANAVAESGLDPNARAPLPELSFGLFQCNQTNGVGKGYTEAQLKNPELNISLIIAEARRAKAFVAASTLEAAVEAFVRYVERPKRTQAAIAARIAIAKKLMPT